MGPQHKLGHAWALINYIHECDMQQTQASFLGTMPVSPRNGVVVPARDYWAASGQHRSVFARIHNFSVYGDYYTGLGIPFASQILVER